MPAINWKNIPEFIRSTIWSANAVPPNFDYKFPVENIDVGPLHSMLSLIPDDSGYSEYESAQVWPDDLDHVDLSHPIIIDRRLPHLVADGMHRVMKAAQEGINQLPSIDVTPMFLELGMPEARNDYPRR
jgi:hypothetical protein